MFKKKREYFALSLGEMNLQKCRFVNGSAPFSKMNRLSIVGELAGKKVKIFEGHNNEHAVAVAELMRHPKVSCYFPSVIGVSGRLVVSEWVSGQQLKARDFRKKSAYMEQVKSLLFALHSINDGNLSNSMSFDYVIDYLLPRFRRACDVLGVSQFKERALQSYDRLSSNVSNTLSHGDLSPANFVITKDGRLCVIDNEILGLSDFPFYDFLNFSRFLGCDNANASNVELEVCEPAITFFSQKNKEDVMNVWLIREIGARFVTGNFDYILSISQNSFSDNCKLFPFLSKFGVVP